MPLRMTGMTSGLDTDSIVSALMEAQTTKKTKVENKKTKLEWTQNIWTTAFIRILPERCVSSQATRPRRQHLPMLPY